ncbi:MAG: hypothetical protein AAGA56_26285, partial [Myxococcota bacterium]
MDVETDPRRPGGPSLGTAVGRADRRDYGGVVSRDLPLIPIHEVQGVELNSPLAGRTVRVRGVVTGRARKGYFVQAPRRPKDRRGSSAIFVYSPRRKAKVGWLVEVVGVVVDFRRQEDDRPCTQLKPLEVRKLSGRGPDVEPVWLTASLLAGEPVASLLNRHEGMLVGIEAGSVFAAPSNPFG